MVHVMSEGQCGTVCPDPRSLVQRDQLTDLHAEVPTRTEAVMEQVGCWVIVGRWLHACMFCLLLSPHTFVLEPSVAFMCIGLYLMFVVKL